MDCLKIKNVTLGKGIPKIIVPMVGINEESLLEEARTLSFIDCDLVEWRVDFFNEVANFELVVNLSKKISRILENKPLLFTFRTKEEGGEVAFTNDDYFELYLQVITNGVIDLLDIELFMESDKVQTIIAAAHAKNIKVVMSNHDFEGTPKKEEIISRLCQMQDKNADICKIAVMPHTVDDVLALLEATNEMTQAYANRPIVTVSMGKLGAISRVAGELFGSAMTFASLKESSAPGQLSAVELKKVLELLSVK